MFREVQREGARNLTWVRKTLAVVPLAATCTLIATIVTHALKVQLKDRQLTLADISWRTLGTWPCRFCGWAEHTLRIHNIFVTDSVCSFTRASLQPAFSSVHCWLQASCIPLR